MTEGPLSPSRRTVDAIPAARFERPFSRLEELAVLTPASGDGSPIELRDAEIVVGRTDEADLVLRDECVSRAHARIRRDGADVVLEDLGSSNGTFVDGVPIVSCVLRNGDLVQIGVRLFYFDRLLQRAGQAR